MKALLIEHFQVRLGSLLNFHGVIRHLMDVPVAHLAKLPPEALVFLLQGLGLLARRSQLVQQKLLAFFYPADFL